MYAKASLSYSNENENRHAAWKSAHEINPRNTKIRQDDINCTSLLMWSRALTPDLTSIACQAGVVHSRVECGSRCMELKSVQRYSGLLAWNITQIKITSRNVGSWLSGKSSKLFPQMSLFAVETRIPAFNMFVYLRLTADRHLMLHAPLCMWNRFEKTYRGRA